MSLPKSLLLSWTRVRNAVLLFYSLAIMATTLPGSSVIPHTLVLPYYLLLPGYAFSLLLGQTEGIIRTGFFSLVWSLAIVGSVYSVTTVVSNFATVPISGVVPILTIIITGYVYYHRR